MNRIKSIMGIGLVSLAVWQMTNTAADNLAPHASFYIGIESNRRPYAYFDEKQQEKGLLVASIKTACQQLQLDCHFVGGLLEELVLALQNVKLNAVLITDPALPPDTEGQDPNHLVPINQLAPTVPLCHISASFLHKQGAVPGNLKGMKIGVQTGSVFHSYASRHYGNQAQIKAFPLLESAVVDMVFDRLDMVLGDDAFFKDRVFDSALDEFTNLASTPLGKIDKAVASMALLVRERDGDLLKQWNAILMANRGNRSCVDLLAAVAIKPLKK